MNLFIDEVCFRDFVLLMSVHEVAAGRISTIGKSERAQQREFCLIDTPERHSSNDSGSDVVNIDAKKK
jgi:hypothetical protein